MRLHVALKLAAAAGVVAVVSLVAVAKSIDIESYRRLTTEMAGAAIGREVRIDGDFKLELSWSPRLVASGVKVANAQGAAREHMLTIGRVEADIGLIPLLRRQIDVRRLLLVEPDLMLERDATGAGNWKLASAEAVEVASDEGGPVTTISIGRLVAEKARIAFYDERSRDLKAFVLDKLTVESDAATAPVSFTAVGAYDQHRIDVSGLVGSLAEMQHQHRAFPLKIRAKAGGSLLLIDGKIGDLTAAEDLDLRISLEGTDVAEAGRLLGRDDVPALGPYRVGVRVAGSLADPDFPEIDAAVGKKDLIRLAARGALKPKGTDLTVTAEADDAAAAAKALGLTPPKAKPLRATAQLSGGRDKWRLAGLQGTIGDSDVAGEVGIRIADGPQVTAVLKSRRLDLADLGLAPPQPAVAPPQPSPAAGPLFSDEPLRLGGLHAFDMDVAWTANHFVARGVPSQNAEARVSLKDGLLVIEPFAARLAGGTISANLTLDAKGETPSLRGAVTANGVGMGELLAALGLTRSVSGGRGDVSVRLSGQGASSRRLAASLNGDVAVVVDQATIDNTTVDLLAFDVMRRLTPWSPAAEQTRVNCLAAGFAVEGGVATARSLLLDTAVMTMRGEATIDLGRETIDATLVPKPKEASLLNLATPMDVTGPLSEPVVVPNPQAVVAGLAVGAAAAAINPIGALLPFVTAGGGDQNACAEAARNARQPSAKAGSAPTLLPDVGRLLENVFGKTK